MKIDLESPWMDLSIDEFAALKMNTGVVVQACTCEQHGMVYCKMHTGKHEGRDTLSMYEACQVLTDKIYASGLYVTDEIKALELYQIVEWMENILEFHEAAPCCEQEKAQS